MHSIVTVSGVAFEFSDGHALFSDLNFSLEPKLTALVGPNGIGKSGLARLLAGELSPSHGSIHCRSTVRLLRQREDPPNVSVENFLSGKNIRKRELISGIDLHAPCADLSGGEWMRVRLAHALDDDVYLILDEPTNDLDRDARAVLLQFLRHGHRGGALLISHDREALMLCQEVLELSSQGLARFGGGWTEYERARESERHQLQSALTTAKRERQTARLERAIQISRQEKRTRRGAEAAARGGMPKILIGARKRRAETTLGRIDAATIDRADGAVREAHEAFARLKIDPVMSADLVGRELPAQRLVAEARAFNVRYGDDGEWLYPHDLQFTWRGPLRLALNGKNGSGKSTLLKALQGTAGSLHTRGELRRGNLAALYIDQRCAALDDSLSVLENIRAVCRRDESAIRNGLARFLFTGDRVFQTVGTLSGGERLRAALARGLMAVDSPELLILDEPTNNLDLANITFLETLVRQFRGAVIVASHDVVFLEKCALTLNFTLPKCSPGER